MYGNEDTFLHILHKKKGSCKWAALNSKPYDRESDALPLH